MKTRCFSDRKLFDTATGIFFAVVVLLLLGTARIGYNLSSFRTVSFDFILVALLSIGFSFLARRGILDISIFTQVGLYSVIFTLLFNFLNSKGGGFIFIVLIVIMLAIGINSFYGFLIIKKKITPIYVTLTLFSFCGILARAIHSNTALNYSRNHISIPTQLGKSANYLIALSTLALLLLFAYRNYKRTELKKDLKEKMFPFILSGVGASVTAICLVINVGGGHPNFGIAYMPLLVSVLLLADGFLDKSNPSLLRAATATLSFVLLKFTIPELSGDWLNSYIYLPFVGAIFLILHLFAPSRSLWKRQKGELVFAATIILIFSSYSFVIMKRQSFNTIQRLLTPPESYLFLSALLFLAYFVVRKILKPGPERIITPAISKKKKTRLENNKALNWRILGDLVSRISEDHAEMKELAGHDYAAKFLLSIKTNKEGWDLMDSMGISTRNPSPEIVSLAWEYIHQNTRFFLKDSMMKMLVASNSSQLETLKNRFVGQSGRIDRFSHPYIDQAVITTSTFLKGRSLNMNNQQLMAQYAQDAIMHYASMAPVAYFFSLPEIARNQIPSPHRLNVDICTGTEALFMDLYSSLCEGKNIEDEDILKKIITFLNN